MPPPAPSARPASRFPKLGTRIVVFFVALLVIVQGIAAFLVIQSNSQVARRTINEQLELVNVIAGQLRRTLGSSAEYDELVASGREGLLDAARRYDPVRGVPFKLYANYRVRGAMLDGVRRAAPLPRCVRG